MGYHPRPSEIPDDERGARGPHSRAPHAPVLQVPGLFLYLCPGDPMKLTRGPNMLAALAETPPGCCIGCDTPLPKPEQPRVDCTDPACGNPAGHRHRVESALGNRITCQDPECMRYYHGVYGRDRRLRAGMKPKVER